MIQHLLLAAIANRQHRNNRSDANDNTKQCQDRAEQIDAQRAHSLGLVSMVADLDALHAEAQALAQDMLRTNPLGLRLTKEALGHSLDMGSLEAVMAMEDRQQILCTQSEDFTEGMQAFLEKREPRYTGRGAPEVQARSSSMARSAATSCVLRPMGPCK